MTTADRAEALAAGDGSRPQADGGWWRRARASARSSSLMSWRRC